MSQAKVRPKDSDGPGLNGHLLKGLRETALFGLLVIALYLLISLATFNPQDPAWSYQGSVDVTTNAGGVVGAWFADIVFYLVGYMAYLLPLMLAYGAWRYFRGTDQPGHPMALRWVGFVITVLAGAGLAHLHFADPAQLLPEDTGGILGHLIAGQLVSMFNVPGTTLFVLAAFLLGLTLLTGLSWLALVDTIGEYALRLFEAVQARMKKVEDVAVGIKAKKTREKVVKQERKKLEKREPPKIEEPPKEIEISERVEQQVVQPPLFDTPMEGERPSVSLLDVARPHEAGYSKEDLEAMSRLVEIKLKEFRIEVEVKEVHPGPVITRFEVQPAPGVKAASITALSRDLARSLSLTAVRVVEVIPGKTTIGLEIPNESREIIALSEIFSSSQYDRAKSPLTLGLGKHIDGTPGVADLAKMPHLLVAGTTGSGKSVAINAMILSILYKAPPEEVRLIMVDPKMLELSVYEGIPHLLCPVVTDMKEAANALRWAVVEMDRRYKLMASQGVRNIKGYNKKVAEANASGQPIPDPFWQPSDVPITLEGAPQDHPMLEEMPYIVIIVDELADMMMLVGKKVEELIARLAQKARACGIHLILATQRPSVDVITGLIKSNIPTRISFQVSSKIDSRTILDQSGAEHLLGHGDMLYLSPGAGIPQRVHGAFVDDHEVHKVVEYLKQTGEPNYNEDILKDVADEGSLSGTGGGFSADGENAEAADALYDEAVKIVTESRKASISYVQRRLKIGYNRAARMVEAMEAAGVVGPLESNGSRQVIAPPPPSD